MDNMTDGPLTDEPVTGMSGNSVNDANTSLTPNVLKQIELYIGVIGVFINLKVVAVMVTSKSMMKMRANVYITSQSFLDAFVALMLIFTTQFEDDGRSFSSLTDRIFCRLWLSRIFLWGPMVSSTYNLVAMTTERYLSIVKPIWHKAHFQRKHVVASIAAAWLIGPVYQLCMKLPTSFVVDGQCKIYQWPSREVGRAVGVFNCVFQYAVPLVILIGTYAHMILVLNTRVQPTGTGTTSDTTGSRARKNLLKTLIIVTMAFIGCWTINQVYFLLFNLGFQMDFTSELYHSSVLLVFINCTLNPFIYMVTYKAYQGALRRVVVHVTRGGFGRGKTTQSFNGGSTATTND